MKFTIQINSQFNSAFMERKFNSFSAATLSESPQFVRELLATLKSC